MPLTPDPSPTPRAEPCEACGNTRSVRAPTCPHCGDKRHQKKDDRERFRDWVVLAGVPLLSVIVAALGIWQNRSLDTARLEFERQLAEQKSAFDKAESDRRNELAEQTRVFTEAEANRQHAWQQYLNARKETKEQTQLALELTKGLSEDQIGESIKSLLLAICFVKTEHLDPQIIDVLTFHKPDNVEFRNELHRALTYMRKGLTDATSQAETIRIIDKALILVSRDPPDKKTTARTVQTILDQPEAASIGRVAETAVTVKADVDLKDKETLADSALMTVLQRVESRDAKAAPTDPLLETVRATLDPKISEVQTVADKLESAARDRTKVAPEARVAAVEKVLGERKRLVIVYGKSEDEKDAKALSEWGRKNGFVASVWNVHDMAKQPERITEFVFRHCALPEAEKTAAGILPKLIEQIEKRPPPTLKSFPRKFIASNEFEVWFPW